VIFGKPELLGTPERWEAAFLLLFIAAIGLFGGYMFNIALSRRTMDDGRGRVDGILSPAQHDYPHPILQSWCAFEYNVARTVARTGGASLLTPDRLSRRVDLLTRRIYVPLGDS
jgi:hypothetical protein